MGTARTKQIDILDLIEQQDPVYKINFAIGALECQLEQLEDKLEEFVEISLDMTPRQLDVYDHKTKRIETLSRVLSHLRIYKDGDKTIQMINLAFGLYDKRYPELTNDLDHVKDMLTGDVDL